MLKSRPRIVSLFALAAVLLSGSSCERKATHATVAEQQSITRQTQPPVASPPPAVGSPAASQLSPSPSPEQPILRVESGAHLSAPTDIDADRDGKLALTVAKDKTARLWELPSGRPLRVFRPKIDWGDGGQLYAGALSPDGSIAAVGGYIPLDNGPRLTYLFDTASGRILRALQTKGDIYELHFCSSGRFLAARAYDGTIYVWDTTTGREIASTESTRTNETAAASIDWHADDQIVVASVDGRLRIYDLASVISNSVQNGGNNTQPLKVDRETALTLKEPVKATSARFSPDGKKVAVTFEPPQDSGDLHLWSVLIVDMPAMKPLFSADLWADVTAWSPNGDALVGGNFRWWSTIIAVCADGGRARRREFKMGPQWIDRPKEVSLRALPNGRFLLRAGRTSEWGIWSTKEGFVRLGRSQTMQPIDFKPFYISADATVLSTSLYDGITSKWGRLNLTDRRWDFGDDELHSTLRKPTESLQNGYHIDSISGWLQYPDGTRKNLFDSLSFGFWLDSSDTLPGYLVTDPVPGSPAAQAGITKGCRILSVDDHVIAAGPAESKALFFDRLTSMILRNATPRDAKELTAADIKPVHLSVIFPGEKVPRLMEMTPALVQDDQEYSGHVVGPDGTFYLAARGSVRCFDSDGIQRWGILVPAAAEEVNLSADGELLVVAYEDGTIRWHRSRDGAELLALFPHSDGKHWVLWTPQGYYDCSAGGEDLIGWHLNRGADKPADFFPASRYREQFYRPDVIDRVLETRDVPEALRLANEVRGRKATAASDTASVIREKKPPVVDLEVGGAAHKVEIAPDVTGVTLRYRVRSDSAPATRIRVMVDGRPALIEAPVPNDSESTLAVDVPVPAYGGSVSIIAENRFASSEPATLQVTRSGKPISSENTKTKPRLFVLAVGVSHYRDSAACKDLPFSDKEVADFAQIWQKQQGRLYESVEVKILTNADATAGNILDGFDWIQKNTGPGDIGIVYLNGHGGNDNNLRYYFCSQDFDPERPSRTSVGFEEIQRIANNVPGKIIFFLDTCHAGNALGKLTGPSGVVADVNRVSNELASDENGAVVFSASTGRQVSWYSSKWKRGLFAQAVIEGLDGKADLFGKGRITIAGLEAYVSNRVPELFKEMVNSKEMKEVNATTQTPTVAKPQTIPDFTIAFANSRGK